MRSVTASQGSDEEVNGVSNHYSPELTAVIQTMVSDTLLSPRFMRKSSNGDATEKFAFDSLQSCITGTASLRMLKKAVQQGRSE